MFMLSIFACFRALEINLQRFSVLGCWSLGRNLQRCQGLALTYLLTRLLLADALIFHLLLSSCPLLRARGERRGELRGRGPGRRTRGQRNRAAARTAAALAARPSARPTGSHAGSEREPAQRIRQPLLLKQAEASGKGTCSARRRGVPLGGGAAAWPALLGHGRARRKARLL